MGVRVKMVPAPKRAFFPLPFFDKQIDIQEERHQQPTVLVSPSTHPVCQHGIKTVGSRVYKPGRERIALHGLHMDCMNRRFLLLCVCFLLVEYISSLLASMVVVDVVVCACVYVFAYVCDCNPPPSSRPLCFPLLIFLCLFKKGVCTASMGTVTRKVKSKLTRACTPYGLRLVYPPFFIFFPQECKMEWRNALEWWEGT